MTDKRKSLLKQALVNLVFRGEWSASYCVQVMNGMAENGTLSEDDVDEVMQSIGNRFAEESPVPSDADETEAEAEV